MTDAASMDSYTMAVVGREGRHPRQLHLLRFFPIGCDGKDASRLRLKWTYDHHSGFRLGWLASLERFSSETHLGFTQWP